MGSRKRPAPSTLLPVLWKTVSSSSSTSSLANFRWSSSSTTSLRQSRTILQEPARRKPW